MIGVSFSRMRSIAICFIVTAAIAISGCQGSSGVTASSDQPDVPVPKLVHQGGNEVM